MTKLNKTVTIGLIAVGAVALMALTIWGAVWVSQADTRRARSAYPKCQGRHAVHKVDIRKDKMVPAHIDAKRCDTLAITNRDERARIIAFGQHNKHVAYDGVRERYLSSNGTFEVSLIQPGGFLFHDHTQEEVRATFTVR